MKKTYVWLTLAVVVLIGAALISNGSNKDKSPFVVFSNHENLNDQNRQALVQRLEQSGIEFRVLQSGDVYIREADMGKAIICCS